MKRIRVILLFLLLGAVVNVVVAWGCALRQLHVGDAETYASQAETDWIWLFQHQNGVGWNWVSVVRLSMSIDDPKVGQMLRPIDNVNVHVPTWATGCQLTLIENVSTGSQYAAVDEALGWPFFSLSQTLKSLHGESGGWLLVPSVSPVQDLKGLPYRPLPIGFILNTFFYAILLSLIMFGTISLLHFFRRKRGLCVKCKYDLRGTDHEACPECGIAIVKANPS